MLPATVGCLVPALTVVCLQRRRRPDLKGAHSQSEERLESGQNRSSCSRFSGSSKSIPSIYHRQSPSDSRFRQGQGVATLMGNHDVVTRVYAATGRLCLCHHLRPRVGAKHSCNQIRNALTGQDSDKTNGMLAATPEDWTRGTCLGLAATKTQGLTSLDK